MNLSSTAIRGRMAGWGCIVLQGCDASGIGSCVMLLVIRGDNYMSGVLCGISYVTPANAWNWYNPCLAFVDAHIIVETQKSTKRINASTHQRVNITLFIHPLFGLIRFMAMKD